MKKFRIALSVIVGLVFVLSAITKSISLDGFEVEINEIIPNYSLSVVLVRLLVGIELLIGLAFLANLFLKNNLLLKLTALLLLFFNVFLVIKLLKGDTANCQCFGEVLPMTAQQSLFKNFVLLALLFLLAKYHTAIEYSKKIQIVLWSLISVSTFGFLLFLMLNTNEEVIEFAAKERPNLQFDSLKLAKPYLSQMVVPDKGAVLFLSATCSHCIEAAKIFTKIKAENKDFKLLTFINGDTADVEKFMNSIHYPKQNTYMLLGKEFVSRSGNTFPAIYLSKGDTVYKRVRFLGSYQIGEIKNWQKK